MTTPLSIPESVSFEEAIALTQTLMAQLEQHQLSESELETIVSALVRSENGARGFFVTYLTDDRPLADQPSEAIIRALRSAPAIVAELLVKNLAMSTAMGITHRRNQDDAMAQGSDRVQHRTAALMQQLQLPEITDQARKLQQSVTTGRGDYQTFLDRWGYDAEQRQQIQQVFQATLG
ncbi:MAG: hypothetical protein IGS50_13245 [Synechococcales cyanobacterium C42_A2020_086]|jgi:hypothetical protein|nr:hypothetical protein [Synechococcales cyanobacterium C42_A2020_086]